MHGYGSRIKIVRDTLGYSSQTEFARALRMTQGTISDWEREETNPGRAGLLLVANLCADSDKVWKWLETGRDNPGIRPKKA